MPPVIPASPIVISCITGIGIQQAERAVASDTNSVIANAIDANVNRPVITVWILLIRKKFTVIDVTAVCVWSHSGF